MSSFKISIHKTLVLNVKHPPHFKKDIKYDYVVTEGQPITIYLNPISNPPVQTYQWLSEGSAIPYSRALRVQDNSLTIIRSDVDMMRNYTLIARNEIGTGSFTFRLNVTFGARLIGPDSEDISVKSDEKETKLICKAQSNPTGSQTRVIWQMLDTTYNWRLLYKDRQEVISSSGSIKCNGDHWIYLAKYRANCISVSSIEIMSTLYISNLVPSDMGRYQCLVNNTIESAAGKVLNLNVPVGAKIILSRRRQFSGGELGQSAKLFCWVFGYPKPKVIWYRDISNLTLISGKKFQYESERLRSGLYNSILTVNFIEKQDYTNYFCQASNDMVPVTARIRLSSATKPDIPFNIRVVNTTNKMIAIEWEQGYNGGFEQEFIVSWKSISRFSSDIHSVQIAENVLDEKLVYVIKDLLSSTQYEIRICSKSKRFQSCQFSSPILVKTSKTSSSEESSIYSTSSFKTTKEKIKSNNIIITITSVSVFVFVILVINILFVSFYLRRRRNKSHQNSNQNKIDHSLGYIQCSNMEMYPALNTNTRGSSINEVSTNNSQRSLDSIKNNFKNNIDQLHGSMVVTSPNHRTQVPMINYTPNHSTSICYQTNTLLRDKILMYPSSIDGNLLNQISPSHTQQNISPNHSIHNNLSQIPYSSLLNKSSIVNSQVLPEIPISSTGIPLQLSPIQLPLESDRTCAAGGLLIPVNHLTDLVNYSSSKTCPEYFQSNHQIYPEFLDERYLSAEKEKYQNNPAYSISYSGTIPHYRQALYTRNDSNAHEYNANINNNYNYNNNNANTNNSIFSETQFSNMISPNDSASNSSTSSNIKRYGDISVVFNKPFYSDSNILDNKLVQSFEDDILDTAV